MGGGSSGDAGGEGSGLVRGGRLGTVEEPEGGETKDETSVSLG